MPVLNASLTSHDRLSVIGGQINPAVMYPVANHLCPVPAATETGSAADPAVRKLMTAHPALHALPEPDRNALLRWSRIRHIKRKQLICCQGDPASAVIFVLDGYAKLAAERADGGEVFLDIVGPGECAGELAALQKLPHDASITALSPCRLLMIEGWAFRQTFARQPEALLAIVRLASERILRATERLGDSRLMTAPARLAKALLYLAGFPSSGRNNAICLPLRLTQSDLGAMTGICREVVNKQLGIWRDAGWIRVSGGTVVVIDSAAISELFQNETWNEASGGCAMRVHCGQDGRQR
jgi:CRP-like cAMP-binding protein